MIAFRMIVVPKLFLFQSDMNILLLLGKDFFDMPEVCQDQVRSLSQV